MSDKFPWLKGLKVDDFVELYFDTKDGAVHVTVNHFRSEDVVYEDGDFDNEGEPLGEWEAWTLTPPVTQEDPYEYRGTPSGRV